MPRCVIGRARNAQNVTCAHSRRAFPLINIATECGVVVFGLTRHICYTLRERRDRDREREREKDRERREERGEGSGERGVGRGERGEG